MSALSRYALSVAIFASWIILLTAGSARAESPSAEQLPAPSAKRAAPEEVPAGVAEPSDAPRLNFMDRRMAVCLAIDAQTGLDLANWAAVHSRDPRVKRFAQAVAAESIALLKVLDERTAGKATAALRHAEVDAAEGTENAPRRSPAKLNVLNAEKVLMQMKCEIADGSSESLRAQLESSPADSVDVTYVGGEVFRQVQMLSTLKVLRKYCSRGFEPLLDETIQSTERHLAATLSMLRDVNVAAAQPPVTTPVVADSK